MKNKFNNKFNNLPEEYFAQKFTNPKLPEMKPYTLRVSLVAMFIFYLVNYFVGCRSDYAVIRYTSYFAFAVTAVMLVLRVIFGQKMIRKHPLAFILCCIYGFGELRLFLISTLTLISANVLADQITGCSNEFVVNCTYIFGAFMLVLDGIINILFWRRTKKRIIAGGYMENGSGFFVREKGKTNIWSSVWGRIIIILGASSPYAAGRFITSLGYEIGFIPVLIIIFMVMVFLFCVLAYGTSLLKGRMHYIRRFGLGSTFEDADAQ